MTKIVIYPDETLDSFYDCSIQYFQDKYHNYPSKLRTHDERDELDESCPDIPKYDGNIPMGRLIA